MRFSPFWNGNLCTKLELKYRVEKISKIKRVEDELFFTYFFYEVFN